MKYLNSASLARHCGSDTLDIRQAKEAWPSAEPLVRRAMSRLNETAIRGLAPASFGLSRSRSCSPVKDESGSIEVVDVVAIRREPQRNTPLSLEPPGFSHGEVQVPVTFESLAKMPNRIAPITEIICPIICTVGSLACTMPVPAATTTPLNVVFQFFICLFLSLRDKSFLLRLKFGLTG